MHELAVCSGIIEVARGALERLPPPRPRVSSVTVRIGRLTSVVPDSLRYYFDVLTPDTPLGGAALLVEEVPVRARCGECAARFEIDTLSFTCPSCASGFVELLSGRELQVVSIDTVDSEPSESREVSHGN